MNKIQTVKTLGLLSAAFVLVAACSKGWKEVKTLGAVTDWKVQTPTSTDAPTFASSTFTFKSATGKEITNTNDIYTNFTTDNDLAANKTFKDTKLTFKFELSNAWNTGTAAVTPFFTPLAEFSIYYNNKDGVKVFQQSFEVISTKGKVYLGTGLAKSLSGELEGKDQGAIDTYIGTTNPTKIKEINAANTSYSFDITVSKKADKPVSKTVITKGTETTALITLDEVAFIDVAATSVTDKKVAGLRSLAISKVVLPIGTDGATFPGELKGKDFKLQYKG